jgi:hypothetical protein
MLAALLTEQDFIGQGYEHLHGAGGWQTVDARSTGATGRSWLHSHTVDVVVSTYGREDISECASCCTRP